MNIVHLAYTPLAGAPIRLVRALQHAGESVRLITLNPKVYGSRTFETDLDWTTQREEALTLLRQADVIHMHHYFDPAVNNFKLNIPKLNPKAKLIRQFHSSSRFISQSTGLSIKEIQESQIPQLVIAQFQERYYPRARVVPNICPLWVGGNNQPEQFSIFFSPSNRNGAWTLGEGELRWDTKGYPEVRNILRDTRNCQSTIAFGVPHEKCMELRANCHAAIDDLVTGSYHLSGLESISQGCCTFTYLDDRVQEVLRQVTGSDSHPFINVKLEEFSEILQHCTDEIELVKAMGINSRSWFERYYAPNKLIHHYIKAYNDLINQPDTFQYCRPEFSNGKAWFFNHLEDQKFKTRRSRQYSKCSVCWIDVKQF